MHNGRRLSVAAVVVGTAVGCACPAWADDGLSGTYNYANETGFTSTWTVTPCGPGCAHVFTSHSAANYELKLSNGRWVATVNPPDAVHCRDGTLAPATVTISVDAAIAYRYQYHLAHGRGVRRPTHDVPPRQVHAH